MAGFKAEWRGLAEYYKLAWNRKARLGRLFYHMNVSLAKTLAAKLQMSRSAVFDAFKTQIDTPSGKKTVLLVREEREGKPPLIAYFGDISLARADADRDCDPSLMVPFNPGSGLLERLLADKCELCGDEVPCEVHHVRKLADIDKPGRRTKPKWMRMMIIRKRKTLAVCSRCHKDIHSGRCLRRVIYP